MSDKADQVGRSAIQNEGIINVPMDRMDDALARLARLESAAAAIFTVPYLLVHWCNNSQGQSDLQETKNVAHFGAKGGLAYQDWVSDVEPATEQVDVEFYRWANGSVSN